MEEDNNKLAEEIEEIIYLTQEIIAKLNMDIPLGEDLSFLQESEFYLSIFKNIFNSENFLEDREFSLEEESPSKIQVLIDFLANDVLFINLEHINGTEIGNGNIAHIKNFLQLICALMNMDENEEEEESEKKEERVEINDVFANEEEVVEEREGRIDTEKKEEEDLDKIDLDIMEYESSVNDEPEAEEIEIIQDSIDKSYPESQMNEENMKKIMLESELDYNVNEKKTLFKKPKTKKKKTVNKKRLSKTKKYNKTNEEAGLKPKYSTTTYFNKTYKKEQYE